MWLPVTGAILLAVVGAGVWLAVRSSRARWARQEAIPRIQELLADQRFADAYALVRKAKEHLPDDPVLRDLTESSSVPMTFRSRPSGATVSYKPYLQPDQKWVTLGTTPLEEVQVPRAELRWRARLEGHARRAQTRRPDRGRREPAGGPVGTGGGRRGRAGR